jgi:hypothetical protein
VTHVDRRDVRACEASLRRGWEALEISRAALRAGHPNIAGNLTALAVRLRDQSKLAEAEPLSLAGYRGMKERATSIPPQSAVRIPEVLERLVTL